MDDLDNIIDLLNTRSLDKREPKPRNREAQPSVKIEEEPLEPQTHLEDLPDLNEVYSKRLERMDRKNESKQESLAKKQ